MRVKLYVIRDAISGHYWNCSSEHGTGWNERGPKQAFSPSEVSQEVRRIIDFDSPSRIEVVQLAHAGERTP